MAKIPFDIKYRPQIESGEYKVETRDGLPARVVCWDANSYTPIVCLVTEHDDLDDKDKEYTYSCNNFGRAFSIGAPVDLFIVTPEEELTEFEDGLRQVCEEAVKEAAVSPYRTSEDFAKRHSAKLLSLAIDARAREMDEALEKSKLDKDSIPYHLIEFMCNLYTCPNWKEIEETAELYVTRIKAAALKDLPRWKKIKALDKLPCRAYLYNLAYERENKFGGRATIHGLLMPNEAVKVGCDTWYLPVDDIKNLPKED